MIERELSARFLEVTTQRILEETAFVWTDVATLPAEWHGEGLGVRLEFSGPGKGRLEMLTTPRLALTVAANMLGIDEQAVEPGVPEQAVGELLNILAGALTVQVFGTHAVCSLGIPEVRGLPSPELPLGALTATTLLSEEGEPLELALFVDGCP